MASAGDGYRLKSLEIRARARAEAFPSVRAQLEALAASYLRLADQADQNSKIDIAVEVPARPNSNILKLGE